MGSQTCVCEHKGGCRVAKSKIRPPVPRTVPRTVARTVPRQVSVVPRSKKNSAFSGEAILGTQRYLEARFSTIAVLQASVFLLVEDDRFSTIILCLPGYYRGSHYFFLIGLFAPPRGDCRYTKMS